MTAPPLSCRACAVVLARRLSFPVCLRYDGPKRIQMSALDKSTRRKIFYGMVALFAIIVPFALLYSRGYIVDLQSRGFVATGGIFVKTTQSGAKVFIDDEFSKETSFLLHGALMTNLLPRRYTVRVEKEGYQPWQKMVRVANGEVLE